MTKRNTVSTRKSARHDAMPEFTGRQQYVMRESEAERRANAANDEAGMARRSYRAAGATYESVDAHHAVSYAGMAHLHEDEAAGTSWFL